MNPLHKEAIRRNFCALASNLDPEDIIGHLYQERALSDEECEDILSSPTRRRRAWKLLYHLRNRDPCRKPFAVFVDSLKQDHGFLADMLENTVREIDRDGEPSTDNVLASGEPPAVDSDQTHAVIPSDSAPGGKRHRRKEKTKFSGYDANILASYLRRQLLSDEGSLSDGVDGVASDSDSPLQCVGSASDSDSPLQYAGLTSESDHPLLWAGIHKEAEEQPHRDLSDDGPQTSSQTDSAGPKEDAFREHFGRYVVQRLQQLRRLPEGDEGEPTDPDDGDDDDDDDEGHHGLMSVQRSVNRCLTTSTRTSGNRDASMKYMFDRVYSLIKSGAFNDEGDTELAIKLRPADADMKCMLLYIEASTLLYKGDIEESKRVLTRLLKLVPFTSVPSKVIVECFSLRCWTSIKENNHQALEGQVRDAMQTILVDPVRCSGRAAAWVLVEEARGIASLMSNNDLARAYQFRARAIECLYKALDHFQKEANSDGLYGCCFVSIKIAALKLACGEFMHTIELQPTEEDIQGASGFLKEVAKREQDVPDILRLNFVITMSDLYFRRNDLGCAVKNSDRAVALATQLGLPQETRAAKARFDFLKGLCDQSTATPAGRGRRWCDRTPCAIGLWYRPTADNSTSDTESEYARSHRGRVYQAVARRRLPLRPRRLRAQGPPLVMRPDQTTDSSTESGTPLSCAREYMAKRFHFTYSRLQKVQQAPALQPRPKIGFFVRIWMLVVLFSGCWLYKAFEY